LSPQDPVSAGVSAGPLGAPRFGRVLEYDVERGLGTIEEALVSGREAAPYRFHSTAIADGSRTIEPGTRLVFVLARGLGGVLEARAITALGAVV